MTEPSRNSPMIARVNRIFFRRSGVRNALPNALSTPAPPRPLVAPHLAGNRTLTADLLLGFALQLGDAAASSGDLLGGRAGEGMRLDLQSNRDLPAAEDLHELTPAYGALGRQDVRVDLPTVGEQRGEPVEVDHLVLSPEPVLEALEPWQPHVQGHLATFERRRHLVTGLGALGATAGGLALGTLAAADPRLGLVRAGSRAQVMDLEGHG